VFIFRRRVVSAGCSSDVQNLIVETRFIVGTGQHLSLPGLGLFTAYDHWGWYTLAL